MENEIWEYGKGIYKVYLEDRVIRDKIKKFEGCCVHGRYYHPNGTLGWDLIFPGKYYDRIADLVGLPMRKKNINRVRHGKKLGKLAVAKNVLGL